MTVSLLKTLKQMNSSIPEKLKQILLGLDGKEIFPFFQKQLLLLYFLKVVVVVAMSEKSLSSSSHIFGRRAVVAGVVAVGVTLWTPRRSSLLRNPF